MKHLFSHFSPLGNRVSVVSALVASVVLALLRVVATNWGQISRRTNLLVDIVLIVFVSLFVFAVLVRFVMVA